MPNNEVKMSYKEILKTEVNKIPEQDVSFIIKMITIIRKHIEKTEKWFCFILKYSAKEYNLLYNRQK